MSRLGTATVIQGDARHLPLPDASVDAVITSPPYFALRDYRDQDGSLTNQIGSEDTPQAWLEALWECTAEMVRVLKPEGSIWVNLGDTYSSKTKGSGGTGKSGLMRDGRPESGRATADKVNARAWYSPRRFDMGVREKSLVGLPWRYAIGCIDRLGLILRRDQIWSKPNGLPESVDDRTRSSHEYFFHLVKQPRYYSAVDEIREEYSPDTAKRYAAGYNPRAIDSVRPSVNTKLGGDTYGENPLGKLPGSVWTIPTEPLNAPKWRGDQPGQPHVYFFGSDHDTALVDAHKWQTRHPGRTLIRMADHFAAYPTEWPRRIITGWTPSGICIECGQGRRPIADRSNHSAVTGHGGVLRALGPMDRGGHSQWERGLSHFGTARVNLIGYICSCDDDGYRTVAGLELPITRPAVVVDPFGGTGTTALVAKALGRHGITIDLSADYCRMATWRVNDPGELAKAARVPKPPPVIDGQMSLLDGGAA